MKITVGMDAELPALDRRHEPITLGVALPRGHVHTSDNWSLLDSRGQRCAVQAAPLERWGDGSIRWALVDFQADVRAGEDAIYTLDPGSEIGCPPESPLHIDIDDHFINVRTGPTTFHLPRDGEALVADAEVAGCSGLHGSAVRVVATDASGRTLGLRINRASVERKGRVRAVIRMDGRLVLPDGASLLDVTARLSFYAGLNTVQVELSVTNPRAARHAGGWWDLGDPGSVLLKDLRVTFGRRDGAGDIRSSSDRSAPLAAVEAPLELYQDSSGGENWKHVNHVNRMGQVPAAFRGYRLVAGRAESEGERATPVVSVGNGVSQLTVAMQHFWENFPKAIAADRGGITLALWPGQYADLHELQGGERKSHTFAFCVGPDTVTDAPLFWVRSPLRAVADPTSYAAADVWAPLRTGTEHARADYDALVEVAVDGAASFRQRRELIDEYGWRNFGDLYADHESVGSDRPRVSHYNNQYDAIAGFATRFLQTGDRRWWTLADELADHVSDIDLYHARGDRAAYSGGPFWHTVHYQAAHTATHRAYSKRTGLPGGGPSNEHNYTTGLMIHYFLTGSERSREAVVQLADWVLDMDDGAKSRFRWIDRRETGLASSTRSSDFHGPGRGAGNSINALLDAHRLTGNPRYLEKADQLVRRCIHPSLSPDRLGLLDAEERWSYTVFLQVLGKYLEYRAERGWLDAASAYVRASLLIFSEWMVEHERPYLDHPEGLEYPTETWAGQDIRKAAVFEFAARHAVEPSDRARYLKRADDFVDYAVSTLKRMPSGTLTRPIVLLLAYGFQRPLLEGPAPAMLPDTTDFAPVVPFMPVKTRILHRLWMAAGLSAAAIVLFVLSTVLR
jgi:hypothetical protein